MSVKDSRRTRLAIVATMSDLHSQPVAYDLAALRRIVIDLAPDLLCAEITQEAWEGGDLGDAALEVREALAPAVAVTDTVLIPVLPTPEQFADFEPLGGWRRRLVRTFDRLLRWGQRRADDPESVNGAWFGLFCHTVCGLTEMLWSREDRQTWEAQNHVLVEKIVQAVSRNDGGCRVLVAVQCQRLHRLIPLLKAHAHLFDLVGYQNL